MDKLFKLSYKVMSCPKCNSIHQKRKKRGYLLKLLPSNKLYKCYDCKCVYITFFNKLKITIKNPIAIDRDNVTV